MGHYRFPLVLSMEWLRQAYLYGKIAPEDVMHEVIARAEADAAWNIWITPPRMERIRPFLDRLSSLDPASAPLWGIPFAIKDNIDLAGVPTTAGCPDYQYVPTEHATVVSRLIAAGAVPVGKTNMDQFATGLVGMRSPYGETHNALRSELISGGSSSGSAVAVARGHATFALGTDTAGSGRVPAALNGVVGFKPSVGAWPTKGVVPASASLDCVSVFTHQLADVLAVDRALRGVDCTDPWSRKMHPPVPAIPAKLCLPKEPLEFYGPYAAEFAHAWEHSIRRLTRLNIPIEYVDIRLFSQAAALLYGGPFIEERWAALGPFIDSHPGSILAVTEGVLRSGAAAQYGAADVFKALHTLQALKMEARKLLKDAVLVLPTAGGTWSRDQVRSNPVETNQDMGRYSNHCNLLDLCAVAVPSSEAAASLPFGITLYGLSTGEGLVYGAAEAFLNTVTIHEAAAAQRNMPIAVCGLHMRGYTLEKQMRECGARFIRADRTASKYRMVKLSTTPAKPGLIKQLDSGGSIELEIWEMPVDSLGSFVASIPAPLGFGKVELQDGTEVSGFICEAYAAEEAEDITAFGGWRAVP